MCKKLLNRAKSLNLSQNRPKNNHTTQKSCFEIQNSSLKIFDGFLSKSSLLLLQTVYTAMQIAYTVIRECQQNRWLFVGKLLWGGGFAYFRQQLCEFHGGVHGKLCFRKKCQFHIVWQINHLDYTPKKCYTI